MTQQFFQDTLSIGQEVCIPESKDTKSSHSQIRITRLIVTHLGRVLSAIKFDDKARFKTYEVYNITTDKKLPLEFVSAKVAIPDHPPKTLFDFSGTAPHASRIDALEGSRISR